jgi:DNA-binding response OmpR family regulator
MMTGKSLYKQKKATGAKILVVDDEEPVRRLLGKLLQMNGYSCILAANAVEAREFLDKQNFDLVLSDLRMPGESGLEFIRHVSVQYPEMVIIAVTALDNPEIIKSVLEIGVCGYIIKPFQPNEILINVANALRHRSLAIENRTYRTELENKVLERTAALGEANASLRMAHEEIEQLLASISSILIEVSGENKVLKWNSAAEKTFGIKVSKAVGRLFAECGIQWEWHRVLESMEACRRKKQRIRLDTVRFTAPDQKEGFLGITWDCIIGKDDKKSGLLLLRLDITEPKILERQRAQAQRLESIGQLAAGIAHEINTPIQYVGDNTRFFQDAFSDLRQLLDKYGELV